MFILSAQLDSDRAGGAFARYRAYVDANASRFPPSALALARAEWYHDFAEHRCPHDGWLEEMRIHEDASGARHEIRTVGITIRLLGAYHDGHIEFRYRNVTAYDCAYRKPALPVDAGHQDWRYDELRLNEAERLVHEIEWYGMRETSRWLIEADDVEHRWLPFEHMGIDARPEEHA